LCAVFGSRDGVPPYSGCEGVCLPNLPMTRHIGRGTSFPQRPPHSRGH
jgi:hypothetical protein